jgi:hypothetical protein
LAAAASWALGGGCIEGEAKGLGIHDFFEDEDEGVGWVCVVWEAGEEEAEPLGV